MPDTNDKEFSGAGQGDNREVVDLYDSKHGKYEEQRPFVADSNTASNPDPEPFTLTSK